MRMLTFDRDNFYLDGKPFRMIAGDVHYFRIHPNNWNKVLDLAVDFGLNAIQTYIPWNAHEPEKGKFNFEGMLDLAAFLKLCSDKGLMVLLRPSPYICSEWDLGGLPSRLLKDRDIVLRTSDPKYLAEVKSYYDRLIPEFLPYLSTKGGPIIAVAIENEYGSFGNDHDYMWALADMLREGGVDVPFYTTDGDRNFMLTFGRGDTDNFFGVNHGIGPWAVEHGEKTAHQMKPDAPYFIGEFWGGRGMQWGNPFHPTAPGETANAFKEALERGGHVSFYMFAGGTNFGFMSGANYDSSYVPRSTSYDSDAPIKENGQPQEKYFECRDVLDEFMGREKRAHIYPEYLTQAVSVELTQAAELFENLDALTERREFSIVPKPMEDYDQQYGLILYTTKLNAFKETELPIRPYKEYKDRANMYIDGKWFATFLRERGMTRSAEGVNVVSGLPVIVNDGNEKKVDVLVENMGRINFRHMADDRKGLGDCVMYSGTRLFGYDTRTLPLSDLSHLEWKENSYTDHKPCFFKGSFDAKAGIDTYVSLENFDHGYVWINGFNLGRYDKAGPQMTLYLPGQLLKDSDNELIVLDIDPVGDRTKIELLDHEILEGDGKAIT